MGRPRKIRTLDEAAGPAAQDEVPENGVIFGNNSPNREFHYGDGKRFKFVGTRNIITDPDLISVLREQSKMDGTLFEIPQEPDPDAEQEPASDPV